MAISVVQSLSVVNSTSGTLGSPTTAGNVLAYAISCFNSTNVSVTVTGCSIGGSADNFAQATAGQSGFASSATLFSGIWVDPGCAGGQTAVAVAGTNLNMVAASGNGFVVFEIAGLGPSGTLASVKDKTAVNFNTTGTSVSTGGSATTTQANEIVIGSMGGFGTLSSFTAGYTTVAINDGAGEFAAGGYQVISSTGSQTFAATQNSSGPWAATLVTLFPAVLADLPYSVNQAVKRSSYY